MARNITHDTDHYEIGAHNITHDVDHYEIGAGERLEIGAGERLEIGAGERFEVGAEGPSIPEDAFPQDLSLGGPSMPDDAFPQDVSLGDAAQYTGDRVEIGAAVRQVIKTARDNRQPPPRMKAVPVSAPMEDDGVSEWFADVAVGCGEMIGVENPFPIMTKLLTRFGAGQEKPRYVRVDTEESYKQFLADHSPEMGGLREHLTELSDKLEQHIHDPHAHEDLLDAIDEAEAVGAKVTEAQATKEIEMWLPAWAKDRIHAWQEGGFICVSMKLPGADGEARICTSMTPVAKAVEEMEQHAAVADVDAAAVVGVLPAMGCVLGAGTLVKEMAAAAPSLIQQPEAVRGEPFVCRIEPKASPALCAFVALAQMCKKGDDLACAEWDALADAAAKSAPYVAQAMREAKKLCGKVK